jgi:amidophosphoribosyltransferase
VEGKRVVMIDDSIVRGTTSRRIVNLLREAGATQVHVRITSPPFKNPCFYGIDTPNRQELIASYKTIEEIRQEINADSLAFLTKDGLIEAIDSYSTQELNGGLCLACFDNDYPTEVQFHGTEKLGCGCE